MIRQHVWGPDTHFEPQEAFELSAILQITDCGIAQIGLWLRLPVQSALCPFPQTSASSLSLMLCRGALEEGVKVVVSVRGLVRVLHHCGG